MNTKKLNKIINKNINLIIKYNDINNKKNN